MLKKVNIQTPSPNVRRKMFAKCSLKINKKGRKKLVKLIESLKIKEKAYIEKLENGLTVIIVPNNTTNKKYVIWGTHFGSIDNHFIMPNSNEEVFIPDGVAHFLEHKMFEQPGRNKQFRYIDGTRN